MSNRRGFPQQKEAPPSAADFQGILSPVNGGLGVDATNLVWPVVQYHRGVLYPFGAGPWYPYFVAYSPTNYLDSDDNNALRFPWPVKHRSIGLIEIQISQEVGVDEDFDVELYGVQYVSGLMKDAAIVPLDDVALTKRSFVAGDTDTQRTSQFIPALIGGDPITHLVPRITLVGSTYYPGEISIFVFSATAS